MAIKKKRNETTHYGHYIRREGRKKERKKERLINRLSLQTDRRKEGRK